MPETDLQALLKRYAELDPSGWAGLHATAETAGKKLKDVAELIVKTMNDPDLRAETFKGQSEDDILVLSVRIVRASFEQDIIVPAVPYTVYVLGKTAPYKGKSKQGKAFTVSNVVGVGKKNDPTAPMQFVKISAFDDSTQKMDAVSPGQFYKVVLKGSNPARLSLPDGENFEPTNEPAIDTKDVLTKMFPVVPIRDVAEHIKKSAKGLVMSDLKLVKARIVFANKRNRQDGSEYGELTVLDDSVDSSAAKKQQGGLGLKVYLDPSWIRAGPGSIVYVLGTLSRREQQGGGSPFVMNGEAVVVDGVPLPLRGQKEPAAAPTPAAAAPPKVEAFDFSTDFDS